MLVNRENGSIIAENVKNADTFWTRFRGLMLVPDLPRGHALHLKPCRSIHTYFMRFPIDVLYLDRNNIIVATEKRMKPRKLGKAVRQAVSIVELPAGVIGETGTEVGQTIEFQTNTNEKGV